MKIVEILTEYSTYSLDRPFTYIYKKEDDIKLGYRVIVEFNHRDIVGYVVKVTNSDKTPEEISQELGFEVSEIKKIIDQSEIINKDLFELAQRISDYYVAPFISVLQTMLPPSLKPSSSSLKGPKIEYEKYLVIADASEEGLTNKQIEILRFIKEEEKVLKREIKSVSIVKKLIELGKIEEVLEEKNRFKTPSFSKIIPPDLTEEQKRVIKEFNESDDNVYLLEGVTGSGKSEVYLRLSEETLNKGKNVLMLVPEISLTPMFMEYFITRFDSDVAILHSELTDAEKYDEYRKIASGKAKIVIGVRSAIFAPLSNIGLIILDEEHTESYKQDTTPTYHAREVAKMRGMMHHAKVLLGSATPSLESRARAQKNIYHLLKLENRINNQPLPKTTIINMLDYKNIDRESYIFSLTLRKEIQNCLNKNEQAILLINRRGYSTTMSCRSCSHVFKCPDCEIPLTYHQKDNMLKCHHCGYVELAPTTCPKCGKPYFIKTGFGTERIEEEVHRLFPNAKTLRLDSDSARVRTKISKTIKAFADHEADILIGTQMIAKGHDFANVTLVGIVLADIGLSMPSYRSSERAFQLITQAVGRSGRGDKKGQAIIQTYQPSHYAITMAARQNYEMFYVREMKQRKAQYYPPYCYLASVKISSKNEEIAVETAFYVAQFLENAFKEEGEIIGPTSPYISYVSNKHIRAILIKFKNLSLTKAHLNDLLGVLKMKSQIAISIDIDPYDF